MKYTTNQHKEHVCYNSVATTLNTDGTSMTSSMTLPIDLP